MTLSLSDKRPELTDRKHVLRVQSNLVLPQSPDRTRAKHVLLRLHSAKQ